MRNCEGGSAWCMGIMWEGQFLQQVIQNHKCIDFSAEKAWSSPTSQMNHECSAQSKDPPLSGFMSVQHRPQITIILALSEWPRSHCLIHQLTPPSLFGYVCWLKILNVEHRAASFDLTCDLASTLSGSTKLCSATVHYSFVMGHLRDTKL